MKYREELQKIYDNLSTDEEKKAYLKKMFEYRDIIINKYIDEVGLVLLYDKEKKYLDLSNTVNNIINDNLDKFIINALLADEYDDNLVNNICTNLYNLLYEYIEKEGIEKIIEESNNEVYIYELLFFIKDDELKLECLDKVNNDSSKATVIASLSSDDLKLECLDKINDDYSKAMIILSLSSDDLKLEYLDKINDDSSKATVISSLSSDDLKLEYLDKVNDDYSKAEIIKSLSSDELKIKCLNKVSFFDRITILKFVKNQNLVLEYFINNYYSIPDINHFFLSENIILEYSETDIILEYIKRVVEYYGLNYDHVHSLINLASINILLNIENKNIKNLINLDDKTFNNFLNLFKEENIRLNSDSLSKTIETILSGRFKIKKSEILNVFSLIKHLIDENNKEQVIKIIQELIGMDLFNEKTKQFNFNGTFEEFINKLFDKNNVDYDKYLEILHSITNEFITLSKNKYINNNRDNLLNKISGRRYNKSNIIKYVIKEYSFEELKELFKRVKKDKLNKEIEDLINNEEILKRIIEFKKNPSQNTNAKELFKYMKTFDSLMNILYGQDLLVPREMDEDKVAKGNDLLALTQENIYNIIMNLNIKGMLSENGILSNQELYDKLQEKLKKYQLLAYGNYLNEVLKIDELSDGILLTASFLNNYGLIADIIEKKGKENLTIYLHLTNTFSDMSNRYALLIDSENYRLIKENPGPNSASMSYDERIKEIPSLVKAMYEKDSITIPPINEVVELENGKKLEVIVGDVTNPINLTHGERTGACMRIGGVGSTLFEFCLKNEQGFHMKFIDPDTSEYISRVSGFRNGNTVFLNELRYSLNNKYSNNDLQEACTRISKMLIEMTKNSSYPIENVIISKEFAMDTSKKDKISLPVSDIKEGYVDFYSDVGPQNAILLASSRDGKLVDIKLGPENCERYAPLRKKVQKLESSEDALKLKTQIEIIDQLLDGIEFEECQYNVDLNDVKEAYFGQDWYFIVFENGEILPYIMKNSKNRDLALQEIYKTVPRELLNDNSELNTEIGGIKK